MRSTLAIVADVAASVNATRRDTSVGDRVDPGASIEGKGGAEDKMLLGEARRDTSDVERRSERFPSIMRAEASLPAVREGEGSTVATDNIRKG